MFFMYMCIYKIIKYNICAIRLKPLKTQILYGKKMHKLCFFAFTKFWFMNM